MKVQINVTVMSDEELQKFCGAMSGIGITYDDDSAGPGDCSPLPVDGVTNLEPEPEPEKPEPKEEPKAEEEKPESRTVTDDALKKAMKAYKAANGPDALKDLIKKYDVVRGQDLPDDKRAALAIDLGLGS